MSFLSWLINITSTRDLTCALKEPSSRGGGGGKFPETDGRVPGSSRGGGGGGRKSPTEKKTQTRSSYRCNLISTLQNTH